MPFTIYPSPPASPTPALAPGAISPTSVQLDQHVGPDDEIPSLNTTYVRITMLGSAATVTPPIVRVRAVHPDDVAQPDAALPAVGNGSERQVMPTNIGIGSGVQLFDRINTTDAGSAAWASSPPYANNVYLLKIVVFISGTRFRLRFENNTAENRQFTWVVADSAAESLRPWIDVTTTPLTYNALINQSLAQTLTIHNYGTAPFQVTGMSPVLGSAFRLPALPVTVNPASHQDLVITFTAPATPGTTSTTSTVVIAPNDPNTTSAAGHNQQFVINTTTQALEVTLLLDTSGSMGWEPNGTPLPAGSTAARISHLKTAVKLFLELLAVFGQNGGKYGIAKFPGTNPADLTTFDVVPSSPIPNTFPLVREQLRKQSKTCLRLVAPRWVMGCHGCLPMRQDTSQRRPLTVVGYC